jgi:soluble P-type ATPase
MIDLLENLERVGFNTETLSVEANSEFTYVNLINNLKIGYVDKSEKFVFIGESLNDCFKIRLNEINDQTINIGLRAIKSSEQYKYAVIRQRYIR